MNYDWVIPMILGIGCGAMLGAVVMAMVITRKDDEETEEEAETNARMEQEIREAISPTLTNTEGITIRAIPQKRIVQMQFAKGVTQISLDRNTTLDLARLFKKGASNIR